MNTQWNLRKWDSEEVAQFIKTLGPQKRYKEFGDIIKEYGLTGEDVLETDANGLFQLGIPCVCGKRIIVKMKELMEK